jgi:hypothetical protein
MVRTYLREKQIYFGKITNEIPDMHAIHLELTRVSILGNAIWE